MGFCHGVKKAFDTVSELGNSSANGRGAGEEVMILGDLVHNTDVVERVTEIGLKTIHSTKGVSGKTVVIRTHGEKKERIEELEASGNTLVDCTCVIVKKVRERALKLEERHPVVVIVGKKNHPEITGLVSWLDNPHVVISEEDIERLPSYDSVGVVSQTTIASDKYDDCIRHLEKKFGVWDSDSGTGTEWLNTVCSHTKRNQAASVESAKVVDKMIVVGAKHSSNSNKLYEKCLDVNPSTIFVESLEEIELSDFSPDMIVGISSGASTPEWIVDEIVRAFDAI